MLSLPKRILIQSILYKTTTCLTRPATTFFVPQMKKRPLQTFHSKEMRNSTSKINVFLIYLQWYFAVVYQDSQHPALKGNSKFEILPVRILVQSKKQIKYFHLLSLLIFLLYTRVTPPIGTTSFYICIMSDGIMEQKGVGSFSFLKVLDSIMEQMGIGSSDFLKVLVLQ